MSIPAALYHRTRFLLAIIFILIHSLQGFSQSDSIPGQVIATFTGMPLPFSTININKGQQFIITDAEGYFKLPADGITELEFSNPMHRSMKLNAVQDTFLLIKLNKNELFIYESSQHPEAEEIIDQVVLKRDIHNPDKRKNFHYKSYYKYKFTTTANNNTDSLLRSSSKLFSKKVNKLYSNQHLLLIESVTERNYRNENKQYEEIIGAKSTNLDVGTVYIRLAQFQSISVYNNRMVMGNKEYISPLSDIATSRYNFKLINTIPYEGDTLYIIKFNPKPEKNFEALKGYLYIRKRDLVVQYCQLFPAYERKASQSLYQSYKLYENSIWFTDRSRFIISSPLKQFRSTGLLITDQQLYDVTFNAYLNKKEFNEVVLEYKDQAIEKADTFWTQNRTIPFTQADSITYKYYKESDSNRKLEKTLRIGESIYLGYVPLGKVNLQTNKIINLNREEGLRLGMGGVTNERFSKKYSIGGYVGFGTKDLHFKAGINGSVLLHEPLQLKLHGNMHHELIEAGAQVFSFDKAMFTSEALRKYQLIIMDRESKINIKASLHPFKYLDVESGISRTSNLPTYSYTYKGYAGHFNYLEWTSGLRYAFGEQHIKTPTNIYYKKSKFPTFYAVANIGIKALGGDYSYFRWDFKIEQWIKILGIGTTSIQLTTTIINGDAPYSKLFNGKGSYQQPSVLIHNSFETMQFNEFTSDRFTALFLSHDFGRLFYKHPNFRPNLVISHNMGLGNLRNPQYHSGIAIKNMNKGYIESGAFISNILVLKLGGLKLGLGAGGFVKYGAYASNTPKDNFLYKFALDVGL